VVVERHGTEQVGDRDPESLRYEAQGILGQVPVALVKRVQEREKRGRLVSPALKELFVRWWCHERIRCGECGVGTTPVGALPYTKRPGTPGRRHLFI
jgi:hypothetical protein